MVDLPRAFFEQSCSVINKKDVIQESLLVLLIQQKLRAEPCCGGRVV